MPFERAQAELFYSARRSSESQPPFTKNLLKISKFKSSDNQEDNREQEKIKREATKTIWLICFSHKRRRKRRRKRKEEELKKFFFIAYIFIYIQRI